MAKPKFDPNQSFKVAEKPKFDPNAAFDAAEDDKVPQWESAVRGFVQGIPAIGPYADEATGALESAFTSKTYKQARDESRAAYDKAFEDNPVSYIGGMAAPSVAVAGLKAIPALGTAASGALGAIEGFGASKEEDLSGMLLDAGIASGVSAATAGLGKLATGGVFKNPVTGEVIDEVAGATGKASKLAPKVAVYLDEVAEEQAARALGLERSTQKKLGDAATRRVGRQALDKGVLSIGADTDDLISRNQALKDAAMSDRSAIYNTVDDAGLSSFNPMNVALEVEKKLAPTYRTPINRGETAQFENMLESILSRGEGNISLKEAQALKEEIGKVAFPGGKRPIPGMETDKQRMAMDAYRIVRDKIDEVAEAGAQATNNPSLAGKLGESNQLYSVAKDTDKLLQNKQAREQGNKIFGLTDTIVGAGGIAGNLGAGAAALGAKKLGERYGSQSMAIGANKLAEIVKRSPEKLGKYAPAFQKAATRGGNALGVTDYILQHNDPAYREMIRKVAEEDEDLE